MTEQERITLLAIMKEIEEDGYIFPNETLLKLYNLMQLGTNLEHEA